METPAAKLVSVGMPAYNGERFLNQALDSLLAQTYENFELIISDNASTDRTRAICQQYAKQDKRIRYIRQKQNIGPTANFNFVLKEAKGEYFMWASHDDKRDKRFIGECVRALQKDPDAVMAFSNFVNIDESGKKLKFYDKKKYFPSKSPSSFIRLYCRNGKANLVYGFWRRLSIVGGHMEEHWGSDMNLVYEQRLNGRFVPVDKLLFYKRLMSHELYTTKNKSKLERLKVHQRDRRDNLTYGRDYFRHLLRSITSAKKLGWFGKVGAQLNVSYVYFRLLITGRL